MSGGAAIILLLLVALVVAGVALGLYGTGGVLWWRKTDPHGDRAEQAADDDEQRRPRHTRPRTPASERADFAGTREAKRPR